MGDTEQLSLYVNIGLREQIEREADEIGITKGVYLRQMVQVGRLVANTGQLDTSTLNRLVDDGVESLEVEQDIHQINEDIVDVVLSSLPSDEGRAMSKEELRELVYGSENEQRQIIDETLEQLYELGEIDSAYDGGYYVKS